MGQEDSNTEICMKAAKISPPDTRSGRISIRFNGLGFIMGCGGRLVRGWSASFVDKSNRDDWHLRTVARLAQARYGRTGFATLKGGSMWEIVRSGTCQDVSATQCGQASWANGACGPGLLLFFFVVKCDRS